MFRKISSVSGFYYVNFYETISVLSKRSQYWSRHDGTNQFSPLSILAFICMAKNYQIIEQIATDPLETNKQ